MHRQHHRWFSPSLNRPMDLLEFGHGGANIIAFPTSKGTFHEWEDRGMIAAMRPMLDQGWFKLICIDSVDAESWYDTGRRPADRAARQMDYDRYTYHELLPFLHGRTANHFVIAAGASFGAFHALSFGLRHPDRVQRILSMSGLCDIRMFSDGDNDDTITALNPLQFLPNEWENYRLHHLRSQSIILAVGNGDRLLHQNRQLSGTLWNKGIGNALREWDGFAHDWPVWRHMMNLYIGGAD